MAVRVDCTIQRVELQLVICLVRVVLIVLLLGQGVGLRAGEEDRWTGLGCVVQGLLSYQERSCLQVMSALSWDGSIVGHPGHQITCGWWKRNALLVAHGVSARVMGGVDCFASVVPLQVGARFALINITPLVGPSTSPALPRLGGG